MAESTLTADYYALLRMMGRFFGFNPDSIAWSERQRDQIRDVINEALSEFYFPVLMAQQGGGRYEWSFLNGTSTLALVSGTDAYNLPDDFGQHLHHVTYSAGTNKRPIKVVSRREIRTLRATDSGTNQAPEYICWRPKTFDATVGQRFEALLFPKPDASYTAEYEYRVLPGMLDETNRFPLGGAVHAKTIISACYMVAERRVDDVEGPHAVAFQRNLMASVQADMGSDVSENRGLNE